MDPSPSSLNEFFPIEVRIGAKFRDLSLEKIGIGLKEINKTQKETLQSHIGIGYKNSLAINTIDILIGGWTKAREILKYGNVKAFPAGKVHEVSLSRHRIISEHEPVMEVRSEEVIIAEFRLTVQLALNFEVAVLKIDGGHIVGITSGVYFATGAVKFGKILLGRLSSTKYHFPGSVKFAAGYKIPQPRSWFW